MSYRLITRPEAESDIEDAFEWYEDQSPGLGSEFVRAVDVRLSGIGHNPLAYPINSQASATSVDSTLPLRNSLRI